MYNVLLIASMLSGYLDDASEVAWNEYKKGLIDLVIAVVAGVTYLNFNGYGCEFPELELRSAVSVYLVLIVVLIWTSINVVNCTDGVDGLSASVAVVTIGTTCWPIKQSWASTPPQALSSWVPCWLTCG